MQNVIPQLKQRLSHLSELANRSTLTLEDVRDIKSEMEQALAELNQVADSYREQ